MDRRTVLKAIGFGILGAFIPTTANPIEGFLDYSRVTPAYAVREIFEGILRQANELTDMLVSKEAGMFIEGLEKPLRNFDIAIGSDGMPMPHVNMDIVNMTWLRGLRNKRDVNTYLGITTKEDEFEFYISADDYIIWTPIVKCGLCFRITKDGDFLTLYSKTSHYELVTGHGTPEQKNIGSFNMAQVTIPFDMSLPLDQRLATNGKLDIFYRSLFDRTVPGKQIDTGITYTDEVREFLNYFLEIGERALMNTIFNDYIESISGVREAEMWDEFKEKRRQDRNQVLALFEEGPKRKVIEKANYYIVYDDAAEVTSYYDNRVQNGLVVRDHDGTLRGREARIVIQHENGLKDHRLLQFNQDVQGYIVNGLQQNDLVSVYYKEQYRGKSVIVFVDSARFKLSIHSPTCIEAIQKIA